MTYCLDANVFIEGWNKYYAPDFCSEYWALMAKLGQEGRLFTTDLVGDEIKKTDDDLNQWLNQHSYLIRPIDQLVTQCLREIYDTNPIHKRLVDSTRQRSIADPWVIAHAMAVGATVVTKEAKALGTNKRIKIPNVCENMGIKCINDFDLIRELGVSFTCVQ